MKKRYLGYFLVFLPFIVIFGISIILIGVIPFILTLLLIGFIVFLITYGFHLIDQSE